MEAPKVPGDPLGSITPPKPVDSNGDGTGNGAGGVFDVPAAQPGHEPQDNGSAADDPLGATKPLSGNQKAAAAVAAVPATAAAAHLVIIGTFLNMIKGAAMAGLALASNLANLILGGLMAFGQSVLAGVMGVGSFVSGIVGGAVSALTAGITTVALFSTLGFAGIAGAIATTNAHMQMLRSDTLVTDCANDANASLASINQGEEGSHEQQMMDAARMIYGVLSAWGMSDENIAGILGNWQAESGGMDATAVQGIFNAPYQMTDEKRSAAENVDNGIGLGQWTGGRNEKLRTYASGNNVDWWTVETQLGFMISAQEGGNADIVRDMIATSQGTPGKAAKHFHDSWERSADTSEMAARRSTNAENWMGKFGGWSKNQALADSILEQSGAALASANAVRAQNIASDCVDAILASGALKEGGLTLEEATKMMALYRSEGESKLQGWYPGESGPGACAGGKADNCVGFSMYFLHRYTSFQQTSPWTGSHGIGLASSVARAMGREVTHTPTPYSVVSGPGSSVYGHTFVVLGIEGDQAIIGEANCGTHHAGTIARVMSVAELSNGSYDFLDVSDLLVDSA